MFNNEGPLYLPGYLFCRIAKGRFPLGPAAVFHVRTTPIDVGHVLIHYLHHEQYQTVKPKGATDEARRAWECETALRVYVVAWHFGLEELVDMAKERFIDAADDINVPAVTDICDRVMPRVEREAGWLGAYVGERLRDMCRDADSDVRAEVLDQIGDCTSMIQVVLSTLMGIMSEERQTAGAFHGGDGQSCGNVCEACEDMRRTRESRDAGDAMRHSAKCEEMDGSGSLLEGRRGSNLVMAPEVEEAGGDLLAKPEPEDEEWFESGSEMLRSSRPLEL